MPKILAPDKPQEMETEEIKINDIIQIVDINHPWYSCLIIVSEVKTWGIEGYLSIPYDNKGTIGKSYNRLSFKQIKKVGTVVA